MNHRFSAKTVTIMYSAFLHNTRYRSFPKNFCLKPQLVVKLQCTFKKTCRFDLMYIKLIAFFGRLFHWLIAHSPQKFPVGKLLTLTSAIESNYMWLFLCFAFFFRKNLLVSANTLLCRGLQTTVKLLLYLLNKLSRLSSFRLSL